MTIVPFLKVFCWISAGCCWVLIAEGLASGSRQAAVDQSKVVRLTSPDGQWTLLAKPSANGNAQLLLKGSAKAQPQLLREYFRSGTIEWTPDSSAIVFIDRHSVQDARLVVFRIKDKRVEEVHGSDGVLRSAALSEVPHNREILYYTLKPIGFLRPYELLINVNIVYLKGKAPTGPASNVDVKYVFDLRLATAVKH